jgi:hypothetical protein
MCIPIPRQLDTELVKLLLIIVQNHQAAFGGGVKGGKELSGTKQE